MSDDIRAWLDHTDTLDQAATPGPWKASLRRPSDPLDATIVDSPHCNGIWIASSDDDTKEYENAEWIAHTRTALPQASAALRAVLDLHKPNERGECITCFGWDAPWGAELDDWPCQTVEAITAALCDHPDRDTCQHEWTEEP